MNSGGLLDDASEKIGSVSFFITVFIHVSDKSVRCAGLKVKAIYTIIIATNVIYARHKILVCNGPI